MMVPDNHNVIQIREEIVKMKEYFMGIDVSKGYADFVILDKKKWVVEQNFQLDDTFEGHTKLYNVLETFLAKHRKGVLYCGVESTGGYENNWYHSLHTCQKDLNVYVARVNPRGVKHHSEAGLKRNTTDKMSAQNVAEYLIAHGDKVTYEKEDYYASARRQWKFAALLTKQKTQLLNQMQSLLYSAHPPAGGLSRWYSSMGVEADHTIPHGASIIQSQNSSSRQNPLYLATTSWITGGRCKKVGSFCNG